MTEEDTGRIGDEHMRRHLTFVHKFVQLSGSQSRTVMHDDENGTLQLSQVRNSLRVGGARVLVTVRCPGNQGSAPDNPSSAYEQDTSLFA